MSHPELASANDRPQVNDPCNVELRTVHSVSSWSSYNKIKAREPVALSNQPFHISWSHVTCGVFAAAVRHHSFPNRTAALRFLSKPCGDLTLISTPQSRLKLWCFLNLTLNFFQKPQRCDHTASPLQDHGTVALRWPRGGMRFFAVFGA